jgi:hypothetical protein
MDLSYERLRDDVDDDDDLEIILCTHKIFPDYYFKHFKALISEYVKNIRTVPCG